MEYKEGSKLSNRREKDKINLNERLESIKEQLYNALNESKAVIERCFLCHGYEGLEKALDFITKLTEMKEGQNLIMQSQPIDMIINLFGLFKERQIDSIQYSICCLFVNLSSFMDDFIQYFRDNGGIEILQSLTDGIQFKKLLSTPKNFRIYMKLIINISSEYAIDFDEDYVINLLKNFTRSYKFIKNCAMEDEEIKLIGSKTIINFFRVSEFSTQEKRIIALDCLSRLYHCYNNETKENVLWCDYYTFNSFKSFYFSELTHSKHINDIIDAITEQNCSRTTYMGIYLLNYIILSGNAEYLAIIENSGILPTIFELIRDKNVGPLSMTLINNLLTIDQKYIEMFLDQAIHSISLELFEEGNFDIKKECVYLWTIIEFYGNALQKLAVEQDFFVKSLCEALEIEDEETITTSLFTIQNIIKNNPALCEFIDTDSIDEVEETASEEGHFYIDSIREIYKNATQEED